MTRSPCARFRLLTQATCLIAFIALAGCQAKDASPRGALPGTSRQVISDAQHNFGTPGFYFLPPMVQRPGAFGPFRPDVFPVVQIDQVDLSPAGCTSDCQATVVRQRVARWTRFWGSNWRRIRVHLNNGWWGWWGWFDDDDGSDGDDDLPDGYFVVRWDSDDFGISLHGIYRVRVLVPSNGGLLELGFSDVEIVANRKEFRHVDATEFTPLIDGRTLKIKFRIDTPALACVNVICPGNPDGSPGTCDPQTGQCSASLPPPGTLCPDDGNPCTTDVWNDVGVCIHSPGNGGTQCRDAVGDCDLPAACDGVSAACPANGFKTADTVCRASVDGCDAPETCTGSSAFCPPDAKLPADTICRAASGDCDLPAACDGVSAACPANGFKPANVVCRASGGACDVEETCTGSSADCPADAKVAAGTFCRLAEGDCDLPASCDGSSDQCPANGFKPPAVVCRDAAGACDLPETCTGVTPFCPPDMKVAAGVLCRGSSGQCDVAEVCNGSSNACPADAFQPDGTSCQLDLCGGPFVCHQNACVPSVTQCPPGTNDGGDGTCLASGPAVCARDDFDALDQHWLQNTVGTPPDLTSVPPDLAIGPRNGQGSFLLVSNAQLALTPSVASASWIFNADTDLGNQMLWRQPIGVNDFDVRFSFAWDWQSGEALLAGVGLTNPDNQLEVRAGVAAPADVPFPLAILRDENGFVGDNAESSTGDMHLTRSGGILTIEYNGQVVFCGAFTADIRNLVIFTVRPMFMNLEYPFGEFDLDSVQVCHPTLTCAPGFADLGNARCERTP
jgi:hypothetical protein